MNNSHTLALIIIALGSGLIGFVCGGYIEFSQPGGVKELTRENHILKKIISDASTGVRNAGAPADLSPAVERQRPLPPNSHYSRGLAGVIHSGHPTSCAICVGSRV
jgi:hypothetical protein